MAKVQTVKQTTFNIEAWKEQGEQALAALEAEMDSLVSQRQKIALALKEKQAQRAEMLKALGRGSTPKVRLRSHIVAFLGGWNGDAELIEIQEGLSKQVPGVSLEKVSAAVKRYVDQNIDLTFDGKVVHRVSSSLSAK